MAGQVLGTPYYMSPEQWGEIPRDQSVEIDGRADIYSLGLVFYEMILGRRGFAGNTLHELRREHVSTKLQPLHELVADIPRGFSEAIERATAKDRGDRQATARVLADELRAGLDTPSRSTAPLPNQAGDLTETVAVNNRVSTNADVNAPTILTADATPTSPVGRSVPRDDGTVYEPAKPQPAPPPPPVRDASATVVESAAMASSVTVPQVPPKPVPAAVPVVAPASKSKAGLLIGVAVVFVILLAAGLGGFLLWNKSRSSGVTTTPNTNKPSVVATAPKELGRYWLELEPANKGEPTTKVAALVPVASGQAFTFHFNFDEDGYVYIFGPGKNNQLTAFLTSKPLHATGFTTNKVSKGQEVSFPKGNTLTLDEKPGTDRFTIIFSKSQLSTPSLLDEAVTFEPLSASQLADFKAFVSKYQETPPVIELDETNPKAQFVKVKTTSDPSNNPLVFDIRIQHN
jgi:hypothetical protein